MDFSALTVEHWIFICLNFLMFAALSYWRIRVCIEANLGDKRFALKVIIAVVLCILTIVSTLLLIYCLPDIKSASQPEYKNLIPGLH